MHDARQVANCLLDIADGEGLPLTHLALQKLVYFAHGLAYARFGAPLIQNRIEAWKRGPVIRELYFSFNSCGDRPIDCRAEVMSFAEKRPVRVKYDFPEAILDHLREVVRIYGPIPAGRLVAMTHELGTPWEQTISGAENRANVGMQISEGLIREFFAPASAQSRI